MYLLMNVGRFGKCLGTVQSVGEYEIVHSFDKTPIQVNVCGRMKQKMKQNDENRNRSIQYLYCLFCMCKMKMYIN